MRSISCILEIDVDNNIVIGETFNFTLYAMADITQYAKIFKGFIPFDKFVIIMYPAIKSEEPEMIKAEIEIIGVQLTI